VKSREALSFEYTPDEWAKLSPLVEKQLAAVQWTTARTANLISIVGEDILYYYYKTKVERVIREEGNSKTPDPTGFHTPEAQRARAIVFKRLFPHHQNVRVVESSYNLLACPPIDAIRCILECEASEYRFSAYDDIDRETNHAELKRVVECCNFITSALSSNRSGLSLSQMIGSEDYKLSTTNTIGELREGAERILYSHLAYREFRKKRQNDPRRNLYLRQLCDRWMNLGGKPTTSFDHRKGKGGGEPSGDFVDFIQFAAKPVLGAMTASGAHRAIENWRKTGKAGRQPRTVFPEGPAPRHAPGTVLRYARLKKSGPRKQS
jgi:hypothetical protein